MERAIGSMLELGGSKQVKYLQQNIPLAPSSLTRYYDRLGSA